MLMRYDGGNTLQSQDYCEEFRALPLNRVECDKLSDEDSSSTALKHLSHPNMKREVFPRVPHFFQI